MNKYEELIKAFESKLRILISEYKSLQEEKLEMGIKLAQKQNDLIEAHHKFQELQKNYDHLLIARNMGVSESEKAESKKRIDKLVREVDNCLALLDE
ncbi:MAG: hypothetical protein Q7U47_01525 [Paludibacter sp.]|nr:hypothetical protein [Paludibacter sp.]